MNAGTPDADDLKGTLLQLEERIARIEEHLGLMATDRAAAPAAPQESEDAEEKLEVQLGQNWFAKAGIVVLAIGVIFLLTFPYEHLPPAVPSMIGYLLVGILAVVSRALRESFQQVSRYLLGAGLLLLYFTTLRLAYFSSEPSIASPAIEVTLLLLVVAVNVVVADRRKSPYLAGLNLTLGYITALTAPEPLVVFAIIAAMSGVAVVLRRRHDWRSMTLLGAALAYPVHLLWAVNNPVFGNPIQLVGTPEFNLLGVIIYAMILGAGSVRVVEQDDPMDVVGSALNGGGALGLLLFLTLAVYPAHIALWHLLISIVLLVLSVLFWVRGRSKYLTFVYSMLGYGALSTAIIAQFVMPDFFVWLCWQSILVLLMAVWFRSRFIVVGNFVIYLLVFIAYLVTAGRVSAVSISFGIVALLSARVMKWKQDRLELKTEMMRNAYLASALFVIPYALYNTVPQGFVSLSWLCVAAVYYVVSRILRSRKYRWMALLTTALTILHVVLVDLVGVNPTIRIVTFLVLGSALLVISMVYSRRRSRAAAAGQPSADARQERS